MALAEALGDVLAARPAEIGRLLIYPAIDTLDEPLLDILAHDFKVDWWDPEYSLEEKRRTLKTSWQVHKTLGTKAAVEKAASAVYPETRVKEWFEYGGEPYHFRMDVELPEDGWTQERHKRLTWRLQYYKNLRSHLDSIIYRTHPIVLENRQALWFMALRMALQIKNRHDIALKALHMVLRTEQVQKTAFASLKIQIRAAAQRAAALDGLLIRARTSNFDSAPIRFNGRRQFDGAFRFDQREIPGPAMASVRIRVSAKNKLSVSTVVPSGGV